MSGNGGIYDGCEAEARIYIFSLPAPLPFSGFCLFAYNPPKTTGQSPQFSAQKKQASACFLIFILSVRKVSRGYRGWKGCTPYGL